MTNDLGGSVSGMIAGALICSCRNPLVAVFQRVGLDHTPLITGSVKAVYGS